MSDYAQFELMASQIGEKRDEEDVKYAAAENERARIVRNHRFVELQSDYLGMDVYYLNPVDNTILKTCVVEYPCRFVRVTPVEDQHIRQLNRL